MESTPTCNSPARESSLWVGGGVAQSRRDDETKVAGVRAKSDDPVVVEAVILWRCACAMVVLWLAAWRPWYRCARAYICLVR